MQVLSVSDARPGMLNACKQHCILCTVSYSLMECTFEKEGKTHTGDERKSNNVDLLVSGFGQIYLTVKYI